MKILNVSMWCFGVGKSGINYDRLNRLYIGDKKFSITHDFSNMAYSSLFVDYIYLRIYEDLTTRVQML